MPLLRIVALAFVSFQYGLLKIAFKIDHNAILGPGRHYMSLANFRKIFVQDMLNTVRFDLFGNFNTLMSRLKSTGVTCEVWVDGSFVTDKSEPEDIDISIMVDIYDYDRLDEPGKQLLDDILFVEQKYLGVLDAYVCLVHPKGDPRRLDDDPDEYADLWGVEHSKNYLKGYVAIGVTP